MINEKSVEIIKELPFIYDEPFSRDFSQIPTMLISNLLKENNVKVTNRDGDEIFGGYNRYVWGPRVLAILKFLTKKIEKG